MKKNGKAQLRGIATGQDGQFATAQARACGLSRDQLLLMRRNGEITQLRYGVWRFTAAAAAPDVAITAMLACWPGAVISHQSAGVFHGLRSVSSPALPEVTVPHGEVRKRNGINIHWSRELPASDVLMVEQVSYTSLARTVLDLADRDDPWGTLTILDDAVALGANPRWIHQRAKALAKGRNGVALVREATHPEAAKVFRSYLERVSAHVYRAGSLPDPEWNVRVYDEKGFIGIVDALWRPWSVVAETEGMRFHTAPAQRKKDAKRFNRILEVPFHARRFSWDDVINDPVEVVVTLHRALRSAGADLDPARIPRKIEIPVSPFL